MIDGLPTELSVVADCGRRADAGDLVGLAALPKCMTGGCSNGGSSWGGGEERLTCVGLALVLAPSLGSTPE
jgi:hypothetical protein